MKKLRITAVLLMLCLLAAAFYPAAAALDYGEYVLPAPNTNASCAIVMAFYNLDPATMAQMKQELEERR